MDRVDGEPREDRADLLDTRGEPARRMARLSTAPTICDKVISAASRKRYARGAARGRRAREAEMIRLIVALLFASLASGALGDPTVAVSGGNVSGVDADGVMAFK